MKYLTEDKIEAIIKATKELERIRLEIKVMKNIKKQYILLMNEIIYY